jgi:hypothetical protein
MSNARPITLPPLHKRQMEIVRSPARFKIAVCGRRFGKTRLGVVACLETALTRQPAWWIGPDYPTASIGWRELLGLAQQIPGTEIQRGERIAEFPGGGWVQVRSAWDPDALRGEGLKRVVVDEAALIAEEAWTQALRPALSDKQGDAFFLTTPKGRNWTYRLWLRGQDTTDADYASWNLPTWENPFIARSEIEGARHDMPDRWFRQEYGAEFLDDAGGVYRGVRAALRTGPAPDGPVFIGGDWAQAADFTVFTAIRGGRVIDLDRFNGVSWDLQFGRLRAFCQKHGPQRVLLEQNSIGGPLLDRAQRELGFPVEGFVTTGQSKRQLIDSHALAVETGEFTMSAVQDEDGHLEPVFPQLVNELEAFEYTLSPSGAVRMQATAGAHDDCVMSAALAHRASTMPGLGSFADAGGYSLEPFGAAVGFRRL